MTSATKQLQGLCDTFYRVDANDRIVEVGGAWDRFALENDGDDAVANAVVGTSIWSNVIGDATRMYLEAVLTRARLEKKPIKIDYFCNSPKLQRKTRMELSSLPDGSVLSRHSILKIQPLYSGSPAITDAKKLVKSCTICKRVRVGKTWVYSEEILNHQELNLFFGLCDDCKASNEARIARRAAQRARQ